MPTGGPIAFSPPAWIGRLTVGGPLRSRSKSSSFRGARRVLALTATTALALATMAAPAGAASRSGTAPHATTKLSVVYKNLSLLNGDTATVYSNGLAEIWNQTRSQVEYRTIEPTGGAEAGTAAALPGKAQLLFDLVKAPAQAYVPGELEVVLGSAVRATSASRRVSAAALRSGAVPDYTTDA